jgi:hypothetical protein
MMVFHFSVLMQSSPMQASWKILGILVKLITSWIYVAESELLVPTLSWNHYKHCKG